MTGFQSFSSLIIFQMMLRIHDNKIPEKKYLLDFGNRIST